jgi:hypothetical protein
MKNNNEEKGFIPPHGGYRKLISYQKAEIIYDGTIHFTNRFFKNTTAMLTRWCRLPAAASKTLLRLAWSRQHPKKWKSSSPT